MMPSDRPSDAIVENDARFDIWMSDYSKKLAKGGKPDKDDRWRNAQKFQGENVS